jgi:hypothetical protein
VIGVAAVVVAAALGFGAGWLAFGDDAGDSTGELDVAVPEGVHVVVDQFIVALETNDFALMQGVVTERFRRPFYQGDPDGTAWRAVNGIEDYGLMDDPFASSRRTAGNGPSDEDLVFYDIEATGRRIVRGDGPWYVFEAQTWREGDRPNQVEGVHSIAVVDVDGTFRIDDAYWAGHPVLAAGS